MIKGSHNEQRRKIYKKPSPLPLMKLTQPVNLFFNLFNNLSEEVWPAKESQKSICKDKKIIPYFTGFKIPTRERI